MATTIRMQPTVSVPPAAPRDRDALAVTGGVPAGLDGLFLQVAARSRQAAGPGSAGVAQGPLGSHGIRLGGGRARWHRQGAEQAEQAGQQEAGWRAARVWPGGRGIDEVGAAAVARPVAAPGIPLWHTVATYPGLGHAEHRWLSPDGEVWHAGPFPGDGAPLLPAVAATRRYVVVFALPVTYRRAAALVGARFPYAWQDGRPARVGLLGRGAPPRWFPVRPGYVFHAVNAYEDGERVVVDVIRHERAFDPTACPVPPPTLWRWTLDLDAGTATEQPLSEVPMELPAVDPRVSGR